MFTVVVQLITSICTEYPIILRSLSFYLQAGTCVRVHQHKKSLLFWDPLHQAVEPMPERSFHFTVTGFRGCIPYHKVDGLVLSRHLKAHWHQTLANIFPGELRRLAYRFLNRQRNAMLPTLYRTAVEYTEPCCRRDCPPWSPCFLNPNHRYTCLCCLVQHDLIPPIAVGSLYRQASDIVSCYLEQCCFLPLPS